jgi:hypothetical protein
MREDATFYASCTHFDVFAIYILYNRMRFDVHYIKADETYRARQNTQLFTLGGGIDEATRRYSNRQRLSNCRRVG